MKISIDEALVPQLFAEADAQPYAEVLDAKINALQLGFQGGVVVRIPVDGTTVSLAEMLAFSRRGKLYFKGTEAVRHVPAV